MITIKLESNQIVQTSAKDHVTKEDAYLSQRDRATTPVILMDPKWATLQLNGRGKSVPKSPARLRPNI